MISRFQKKPVTIEAVELTRENMAEVKEWCGGVTYSRPPMRAVTGIAIDTLEGRMVADYGDWIIKGVKGEFYPCKPDIFAETYGEDIIGEPPAGSHPDEMKPRAATWHAERANWEGEVKRLRDHVASLEALIGAPAIGKPFADVIAERKRQDEKHGADRDLDDGMWLKILVEEVGEVAEAMLEKDLDNLRVELVQVAAVAIATIENLDRAKERPQSNELESANAKLRAALAGLIGVSTKAELQAMLATIEQMPMPEDDRANTITAIRTLIENSP